MRSEFFLRPVRTGGFYEAFYGQTIHLWEVDRAFSAWFVAHRKWVNDDWCFEGRSLRFTRPSEDFTVFWPLRTMDVVAVGDGEGDPLQLRLQIHNNISDAWDTVLERKYLIDLVQEFLQIDDPEEELICVTIGPYKPVFCGYRALMSLIDYPPCTCQGCSSPVCAVRRR
jgi:hypothetical protein